MVLEPVIDKDALSGAVALVVVPLNVAPLF
jgi:hypothetical protein